MVGFYPDEAMRPCPFFCPLPVGHRDFLPLSIVPPTFGILSFLLNITSFKCLLVVSSVSTTCPLNRLPCFVMPPLVTRVTSNPVSSVLHDPSSMLLQHGRGRSPTPLKDPWPMKAGWGLCSKRYCCFSVEHRSSIFWLALSTQLGFGFSQELWGSGEGS